MSVYRYVRREGAQASGTDTLPSVEVTLTNPDFKAELDRTMHGMGFEFAGSREERLNAVAPGFPGAPGADRAPASPVFEGYASDRPTPVATPRHGSTPMNQLEEPGGWRPPSEELDALARGIAPSWGAEAPPQKLFEGPGEPFGSRVLARFPRAQQFGERWGWVLAALLPVLLVQAGALGSAFNAEDFVRLYDGAAHGFLASVTKQDGVHTFPLARALIWTLNRVFGAHTGFVFFFPVALHLGSVVLLRLTLLAVTKRPILSTAIAAAWGISPVHQETLSEVWSLGAVLATALGLAVLYGVVSARERDEAPSFARLLGFNALLVVAGLSASTGTALAVALPLVALVLPSRGGASRRSALSLLPASVVSLAIYAALRVLGPPEPLGRFVRGFPLVVESFAYGVGNFLAGPFLVVGPAGKPAALIGEPSPTVGVAFGATMTFLVATALAWAFVRAERGLGRRVSAFALVPAAVYAFFAFGEAKLLVRDGIPAVAVRPEPHYAALAGIALALGVVAARAKPVALPKPWMAPALLAASGLFVTLLAWSSSGHIADRRADLEKGLLDVERAIERALGAVPADKDAYLENADVPPVPRAFVGRDRFRFPGLLGYVAVMHPGGIGGRAVHFVELDGKLVARLREGTVPRVASLVESSVEAQKAGHVVTAVQFSHTTAKAVEDVPNERARVRPPAASRKRLPFAKP